MGGGRSLRRSTYLSWIASKLASGSALVHVRDHFLDQHLLGRRQQGVDLTMCLGADCVDLGRELLPRSRRIGVDPTIRFSFFPCIQGSFSNRAFSVNYYFPSSFGCLARVTVLSAVGVCRRNIWSEAQALQCPQRTRMRRTRPNGLPRSQPAPSPRWATFTPERVIARMYPGCLAKRPELAVPATNGTARRIARCCAGSRTTSWRARHVPCLGLTFLRWPAPSPSGPRPV